MIPNAALFGRACGTRLRFGRYAAFLLSGLLVTVALGQALDPRIVAGPATNSANGHVYYLLSTGSWTASEATAVAMGGHLATINDPAENAWVYGTFQPLLPSIERGGGALWIGLHDPGANGRFVWVNGEPVGYVNFQVGQPDGIGSERFVHIWGPTSTASNPAVWGQWNNLTDSGGPIPCYGVVEVDPIEVARYRWDIGIRNTSHTEFSIENNRSDPAPGVVTRLPGDPAHSATANPTADDDFYFSGTYPVGFNGLSAWLRVPNDEPSSAWERALTSNDRTNRFHIHLARHQVVPGVTLRLSFRFSSAGKSVGGVWQSGFSQDQIAVRLRNSSVVTAIQPSVVVTNTQDFTMDFTPAALGAVAGPNTIEFERLGPTTVGTVYAINFDYVRLEQTGPVTNAPPNLTVADQEVDRTSTLHYQLAASDDTTPPAYISYWKVNGPAGLEVSSTGLVAWTPGVAVSTGDYSVTVGACDLGAPILTVLKSFRVRVGGLVVGAPTITSQHPIRPNGSVRMLAPSSGGALVHFHWYEGLSGDTSKPVGLDSPEFTSPHLVASTPYWVRATNAQGEGGNSPETTVEVLPAEGVRLSLTHTAASYTQFGDPYLTLSDPDNGIWSPGNQSGFIDWAFDPGSPVKYLLGTSGRADVQFWITSPANVSLGSFRLKYSTDSGDSWQLLQFAGAECSDGATLFSQNQDYFAEPTLQIIAGAAPVRTTYRVYTQVSVIPARINTFRLEAAKGDPHLPSNGPGRGANGYFELSEVAIVDWSPPPIPPTPSVVQTQPVEAGRPLTLRLENSQLLNLSPAYDAHYEWYQGEKGDLSNPVGETTADTVELQLTALAVPASYWVRLRTVNGVSDGESVLVPMKANAAPDLAAVPPQQVLRYKKLQLALSATDDFTPAASLVFSKLNGPAGLTVSPTGAVEWTPGGGTLPGSYLVTAAATDNSVPPASAQVQFTVLVVDELLLGPPQIVSRHPIRPNGTVQLLAPSVGGQLVHFQWYEGATGDTHMPVGTDAPQFTTPNLVASTPYWVHATDSTGQTGDSPEVTVEVLSAEGVRLILTGANASYTQFGDPSGTIADPDGGIWSPGNQSAWIGWDFDTQGRYLLGVSGRADIQFWITSPPNLSLGSFRLKYTTGHSINGPWEILQFAGASCSDGANLFQQNRDYFPEPTLQITEAAAPVRTTYRVDTQVGVIPSRITGIRLESAKGDPHLPDNGPGRGANGNFELSEVAIVDWSPPPAPPAPSVSQSQPVEAGTPLTLRLDNSPLARLAIDYDAYYEWYQGEKGDLTHFLGETRTDTMQFQTVASETPTSFWVRLRSVNGVSDGESVRVDMKANAPPVLAAVPAQQILRYKTLRLALSAADDFTPAASLVFSKVTGPAGLTVSASGAVEWTPGGVTVPGSYPVTVSVTDASAPSLVTEGQFTVLVVDELLTGQPRIASRHPIRTQGSVRLLAPEFAQPLTHFRWYEGLTGDTSKPVGTDAPEFTTPRLDTSTPYWVHVTDTTGHTGDSPETMVEVLPAEGARVTLDGAEASYTQFGDPNLTTSDPDNGIWAPGNQSASIRWGFNPNQYVLGRGGRADVQFWITSPPNVSLGSFRLKYTTGDSGDGPWELLQFGAAECSDGATLFQQNRDYFPEPTLQITEVAAPVRTTYRVYTQVSSIPSRIKGIRLEAAKGDPHLPASGPGRGANGYFELSEVAIVDWSPMPPLGAPYADQLLVGGTPFYLSVPGQEGGYPYWLAASYHAHFEWYSGERGDLSHLIAETEFPQLLIPGLDRTTSFWVRMTTVNGTVDSETGLAVVNDLTLQLVPPTECHQGEVLVPLRVRNFSMISGLQGTIQWDPAAASLIQLEGSLLKGLSEDNLSGDPAHGTLRLVWNADVTTVGAVSVPDDADLITLRFKLIGPKGSPTRIHLTSDPTPWKVFGAYGSPLTPVLGSAMVENFCPTLVSGEVHYFSASAPVPDLQMSLSDAGQGSILAVGQTAGDGVFGLDVPEGHSGEVVVSAPPVGSALGESPTQGITMLDAYRIREHLLGIGSLAAPYELLAADVDRSGDITVGDVLRVTRLVVWGDHAFGEYYSTNVGSWRFVSSQHPPADLNSPWNWPASDSIAATLLSATEVPHRDFVAIKIGDVNGSWDPGSGATPTSSLARQAEAAGQIRLTLDRQLADSGGTVRVMVRSSAAEQLTTAQFSLNWDPAVLQFAGVEGFGLRGLDTANFGTNGVSSGRLAFGWDDPQARGVPVGEGDALFTVVFTVVGGPGSGSVIRITSQPTFGELSVRGRSVPFTTADGLVAVRRGDGGALGMSWAGSGQMGLWFEMPVDGKWVLEASEDLRRWEAISEPASTSGGGLQQVMVPDAGGNNRFYRVTFDP